VFYGWPWLLLFAPNLTSSVSHSPGVLVF
jgi:hypothetical protein